MRMMVNEAAEEVATESEEEEPLAEALVTEGESLGQEPLAEDTPSEDLTGERHVASAVLAPEMIAPCEGLRAEEDIPNLEPTFPEVAPGPQLIAEVPTLITEPIIQEPEPVRDPIVEEAQVPPHFHQLRDSLRYLYRPLPPPTYRPCAHLQPFRPTVGEFADDREMRDVNNPQFMDIDATSFFMLSQDLPLLLGALIKARQS
jgi:hypothetical protein